MKMSRKFITAGVAGVMALGIAVSAWAAEPQITDQKKSPLFGNGWSLTILSRTVPDKTKELGFSNDCLGDIERHKKTI